MLLTILPERFENPFLGIMISVLVYAVGGGLLEVLISPMVEACPTKNKEKMMSLLHSFYCWGYIGVVLLSTLFFVTVGIAHWKLLLLLWSLTVSYTHLAALCASVTQQANILNIGTEGIMLVGAFFAVIVSYFTGSWFLGILAAMLAGLVIAMIMAVGHIRFGADICGIGMGINMLALAVTKFLLQAMFGKNGSFSSPDIVTIPKVHIPFLDNIEVLNKIFNNWNLLEWVAIIMIGVLYFAIYKTVITNRFRLFHLVTPYFYFTVFNNSLCRIK